MSRRGSRLRLWIVSPVYNDAQAFTELRQRILQTLMDNPYAMPVEPRFCVIDDTGGLDAATTALALEAVEVLSPPFNLGHQRALVYGLRTLSVRMRDDDVVVTLDADGEDRPEDLNLLVKTLLAEPADLSRIVLARRTQRQESIQFRVMYLCFRVMFRTLTGTSVRTGNYAAYRGWVAKRLLSHPYFDLSYSSSFISLGVPLQLVACPRGRRYAGKTHMTYSRLITHGMRMLMPFLDRMAVRAMILFSATFVLGVLLALVVLGIRIFTRNAIPGWATSTLLLVLILSFVALGNFVVVFALFAQSRGISLANLEGSHGSARRSSTPPD